LVRHGLLESLWPPAWWLLVHGLLQHRRATEGILRWNSTEGSRLLHQTNGALLLTLLGLPRAVHLDWHTEATCEDLITRVS
jgi:hypothetical protein